MGIASLLASTAVPTSRQLATNVLILAFMVSGVSHILGVCFIAVMLAISAC